MGFAADVDQYEDYTTRNKSRTTSLTKLANGTYRADPSDAPDGFFISGNLPTTDDQGVHSQVRLLCLSFPSLTRLPLQPHRRPGLHVGTGCVVVQRYAGLHPNRSENRTGARPRQSPQRHGSRPRPSPLDSFLSSAVYTRAPLRRSLRTKLFSVSTPVRSSRRSAGFFSRFFSSATHSRSPRIPLEGAAGF